MPFSLTLDAANAPALGEFWALALGYRKEAPPQPFTTWPEALTSWGVPEETWDDYYAIEDPSGVGPRIFIQKVPEVKTAKNRVHLDVRVSESHEAKDRPGMRAKADELVAAGAVETGVVDDPQQGYWIVMADPEGNEFCIV